MKNLLSISLVLLITATVSAQKINLTDCVKAAITTSHIVKNKSIYKTYYNLARKLNYLPNYPAISLNGKAAYQSDVVEFDFDLPIAGLSFPEIPHAQFQTSLDINQRLYDWGLTQALLEQNNISEQIQLLEIDITEDDIEKHIIELYLSILLSKGELTIHESIIATIDASISEVTKAVEHGMLISADIYKLENQKLVAEQKIIEISSKLNSAIARLSLLTGLPINHDSNFTMPEEQSQNWEIERPENLLFGYKKDALDILSRKMEIGRMSQMLAFSQLGYGRPGLNILSDQWDVFFIAGVKIKWEVLDYKKTKTIRNQISLQQEVISNQEEDFDMQLRSRIIELNKRIEAINQLIIKDLELVESSENISASSRERLSQGVASSREFIQDINAEKIYRINLELHKIQLVHAKLNMKSLTGN